MAINQDDKVIRQIKVGDNPHEICAKYLDEYTYEEINDEFISRLQGNSRSSVNYDPFIKLSWEPGTLNDNLNDLCPDNTDQIINETGYFRSYTSAGASCLDIKVDVLSWANSNTGVKERFMQTVIGPITLNNADKTKLIWVNGVPGSGPGHYYRLSERAHDVDRKNRTWSEWKPVNNSYIEPLQNQVLTPIYSNPQLDFNATNNNSNCYGYVGTLKDINVNGDLILIDSISVYVREGNASPNLDTPVWCRLLKFVNNTWKIVYQSTESKTIRGIAPETLFSFKMKAKDDADKLIKSTDRIAITYVNSETASVLSGVELGFKAIIGTRGGLVQVLANNSTGHNDWCPAFVIKYLSMAGNVVNIEDSQTISGAKNFTSHIGINGGSYIRTNIDPGEFKVCRPNTDDGFIIRTSGDKNVGNVYQLQLLTTNGSSSYQYNFPKQNGDVLLYKTVTYSELVGLKNNSQLVPGGIYRISDYVTYTSTAYTSSAGNLFDILVVAISKNELSENAKVCLHDGDTYFSANGAKLESWEIKYCIDNDDTRFQWINGTATNRKGVIYYMKDEWGNEAPYDFKNILFKKNGVNYYTFSLDNGGIKDATVTTKNVYNNKILPLYDSGDKNMILNHNTFLLTNSQHLCMSNYIGQQCKNNTFGSNCMCNTLESYCTDNTFRDNCQYNEFGEYCTGNTLGNFCQSNVFGVNCTNNKFGNYTLRCNIGNKCSNCKITDNNGMLLSYVKMIEFGDECSNVNLWTDDTNSGSGYVQNYKITNGLSGSIKITGDNIRGKNYQTIISKNVYGDIVQFVLSADTVIKNIKYSDLKDLRDNNKLIPGQKYRITDYVTTTSQENTKSAGYQFDIIVEALSENTLSEDAKAIQHENDGYFDESNLEAWELKYCLDNDTSIFVWANVNGKGVIYYMKDEFNNECPYDFKNIKFYHQEKDNRYLFTFSWVNENGDVEDLTLRQDLLSDEGIPYGTHDNIIKTYYYENRQQLNDVIFISSYLFDSGLFYGCYSNSFGYDCYHNSFGDNCCYNSFGDNCYHNSFGYNCYSNSFSNNCNSNSFSNNCYHNSFGNYCYSNDFGNDCYSNSFGNYCNSNSFGNNCNSNSFGNSCLHNSFGNNCDSNGFYDDCNYNSFGNDCKSNSFGNYCYSNSFVGDSCCCNSFGNNCTSNNFGNSCSHNSFGNNCNSNGFYNDCNSNSFGNNCDSNGFYDNCNSNSFGNYCYSNSFGNDCKSNSFGNYCYSNSFVSNDCKSNSFGNNCYHNSFGNSCDHNIFGNDCNYNSFGNSCDSNSFGNSCYSNNFGKKCNSNSFGNSCYHNSFGDNCKSNIFDIYCDSNSFGNYCYSNNFGNDCNYNSFGNYCIYNSFGKYCYCNGFYNDSSYSYNEDFDEYIGDGEKLNYVQYVTLNEGCHHLLFYNSGVIDVNNKVQNITVTNGVKSIETNDDDYFIPLLLEIPVTNNEYELKIARNVNGDIKMYCEADLDANEEIVVDNYNGQQVNIKPNKYYKFMNISTTLSINFEDEPQGKMKNYMFEVRFAEGCNTLTLPVGIEWANGVTPQICKEGGTYQISVINKLGIITEFN